MSRRISEEKKVTILSKIRENKHILFGAFSDLLTKSNKSDKWREVYVLAQSLNIVPEGKDWTYIRDVFWQNCRKYAIAKLDNSKKTGSSGGKDCKLSSCDNIVLDIIGQESAVIIGLGVEESMEPGNNDSRPSGSRTEFTQSNSASLSNASAVRKLTGRKRLARKECPTILKKRKLMIEHLELQNYKIKLEIALLEKELGYPPSTLTKSLADGGAEKNGDQDLEEDDLYSNDQ